MHCRSCASILKRNSIPQVSADNYYCGKLLLVHRRVRLFNFYGLFMRAAVLLSLCMVGSVRFAQSKLSCSEHGVLQDDERCRASDFEAAFTQGDEMKTPGKTPCYGADNLVRNMEPPFCTPFLHPPQAAHTPTCHRHDLYFKNCCSPRTLPSRPFSLPPKLSANSKADCEAMVFRISSHTVYVEREGPAISCNVSRRERQ